MGSSTGMILVRETVGYHQAWLKTLHGTAGCAKACLTIPEIVAVMEECPSVWVILQLRSDLGIVESQEIVAMQMRQWTATGHGMSHQWRIQLPKPIWCLLGIYIDIHHHVHQWFL